MKEKEFAHFYIGFELGLEYRNESYVELYTEKKQLI